jgi:hypothetical protein
LSSQLVNAEGLGVELRAVYYVLLGVELRLAYAPQCAAVAAAKLHERENILKASRINEGRLRHNHVIFTLHRGCQLE